MLYFLLLSGFAVLISEEEVAPLVISVGEHGLHLLGHAGDTEVGAPHCLLYLNPAVLALFQMSIKQPLRNLKEKKKKRKGKIFFVPDLSSMYMSTHHAYGTPTFTLRKFV